MTVVPALTAVTVNPCTVVPAESGMVDGAVATDGLDELIVKTTCAAGGLARVNVKTPLLTGLAMVKLAGVMVKAAPVLVNEKLAVVATPGTVAATV